MKVFLVLFSPFSRLICWIKSILCQKGVLKPKKAPLPVIGVGNISFGGTGKTPVAMELIAFFLGRGWKPALISRGYKGSWETKGGILSDGRSLLGTWRQGGDEPFLAAKKFPEAGVLVGRNRLESCRKAKTLGFTVAVLDDAFQHRRLEKDLDIVIYDPRERTALRENRSSLRRAEIILIQSPAGPDLKDILKTAFPSPLIFECSFVPRGFFDLLDGNEWPEDLRRGRRILAFSGIAKPKKFVGLLEAEGMDVISSMVFPDHYSYPAFAHEKIARRFRESGAEAIVTTEKDAVKIAGGVTPLERLPVFVLKIGLEIEAAFYEAVEKRINRNKHTEGLTE